MFIVGLNFVKVGDFGFSILLIKDSILNIFCGLLFYVVLELFKDEYYIGVYVDLWVLGIFLYFMVIGVMLFWVEIVGKLKKCILDGIYYLLEFLFDCCKFFIRNILRFVFIDRFIMEEIKYFVWLEGEFFLWLDIKYSLWFLEDKLSELFEDERDVLNMMKEFGIFFDLYVNCRDLRDSIIGIYRVILYWIVKKKIEFMWKMLILSSYSNNNYFMIDFWL